MKENKIKILYIIPRFHPFKGGAEQNIQAMAERMAENGHDVTVYTTNVKFRSEKLPKYEEYNGMKIHRHWALNEMLYLGFYPALLTKLWKNDFDVIHVSGFGFLWVEFCLLVKKLQLKFSKRRLQAKFINTPHGPFMAITTEGFKMTLKRIYTLYLRIIVPYLYDRVIAVVDTQWKWMTKEYFIKKENIVVIPNGIDQKYVEKNIVEFSKDDKVVITFVGRMEWYKGVQQVLNAIVKMNEKFPKLKDKFSFWIIGRAGNHTEKLKEIINENKLEEQTKFVFSPSDQDRDEAYLQSQVHILPSRWEATGIVLIEAMAKGNVIISTNQNDAVDMLITKESGFRYDFQDIDALTEILANIIEDYKLRQKMRLHNLSFAKEFTWEAIFPKYENVLIELKNGSSQD